MKYAIGLTPTVCFSLLLLGCGREDTLVAPQVSRLTSTVEIPSAVVSDPQGDAVASDGSGVIGKAYQDIVRAELTKKGNDFVFLMDVAGPLPDHPVRRRERALQEWSWNLNTDPSAFPAGFPFAPGEAAPPEFNVFVLWDGRTFRGILIDRRPLLVGLEVRIIPIHFEIKRTTLRASVDGSLLGNPESFIWIARTNNWPSGLGNGDPQTLDRAPDNEPAVWPQ